MQAFKFKVFTISFSQRDLLFIEAYGKVDNMFATSLPCYYTYPKIYKKVVHKHDYHCTVYTLLYYTHCITLPILYYTHCITLPILYYTILYTLYNSPYTILYTLYNSPYTILYYTHCITLLYYTNMYTHKDCITLPILYYTNNYSHTHRDCITQLWPHITMYYHSLGSDM